MFDQVYPYSLDKKKLTKCCFYTNYKLFVDQAKCLGYKTISLVLAAFV